MYDQNQDQDLDSDGTDGTDVSTNSTETIASNESEEEIADNEAADASSSDWEHSVETSDLDTTEDSNSEEDQEVIFSNPTAIYIYTYVLICIIPGY